MPAHTIPHYVTNQTTSQNAGALGNGQMSAGGDLGYVGQWKRPAGLLTRADVEVKRFETLASSVRGLCRAFSHGTAGVLRSVTAGEERLVSARHGANQRSGSFTVC